MVFGSFFSQIFVNFCFNFGINIYFAKDNFAPMNYIFDFRHFKPLSDKEIQETEKLVNEKIQQNLKIEKFIENKDKAIKMGATAIFGEKYGEKVRVVKCNNFSIELCGGTHVDYTGEIGLFVIKSETSIASGIRRIEALTGKKAVEYILELKNNLIQISQILKTSSDEILNKIQKIAETNKELEKKLQEIKFRSWYS
jgi:alanyl-tRNA synthetase